MKVLENKVALVTGGTSGIGKATAIVSAFKRSGSTNHHKKHWASISIFIRDRSLRLV